jgi:TolA-binding protein
MRFVAWMLALVIVAGLIYAVRRAYAQWLDRDNASEARMASLLAQARSAAGPAVGALPGAAAVPAAVTKEALQERLLFDAAAKTAQAGEPVLAIQLYARLLSRYPQSTLAAQARAAVAEQKTKLART